MMNLSHLKPKPPSTMGVVGIGAGFLFAYLLLSVILYYALGGVVNLLIDDSSLEITTSNHVQNAAGLISAAVIMIVFYLVLSSKRPLRLYFKRLTGRGILTALKYFGFETLPQSLLLLLFYLFGYDTGFGISQSELILPTELALVFVALVAVAPISEEIICRGFIYAKLRHRHKFWAAASISGAVFTLAHVGYYLNPFALASVFIGSYFLSRAFEKTRNLWVPIIIHALFNARVFVIENFL